MLASNKEWKLWGALDPLFAVASWRGRGKDEANAWTSTDFYELGELDWRDFRAHWERYGIDRASCAEIGCGAGRITKQLAACFGEVHALDVSESMLQFAREHIDAANIAFQLVDGNHVPLADATVSAVFSCHVFQHFDSTTVAAAYFRECARIMKPGGTLMIHLPIYEWPSDSPVFRLLYRLRQSVSDVRAHVARRLMMRGLAKPIMRSLRYAPAFLFADLSAAGFSDVEISVFPTSSNGGPHPFVFARLK